MIKRNLIRLAGAGILPMLAASCGGAQDSVETSVESTPPAEEKTLTHEMHGGGETGSTDTGVIDHAAGVVVEVDLEGKRIKLDHDEMPNIGMSAMTMFFGVAGDVDLGEFEAGDKVRFMVKQGRDGSYRIMAMCDAVEDGADCL